VAAAGRKLHHLVPRFYLRAWANREEQVYCLQDGRILRPNVKNVCAQNYFYRLQALSQEDVDFLRTAIINDSPKALKAVHEQLIGAFTRPFALKQKLLAADSASPEAMAQIERLIVELNEDVHTSVEERFRPYLHAMIEGKLDFLKDPPRAAEFFWGLALQYMRTDYLKRARRPIERERLERYNRIANLLAHIVAFNAGFSLFLDRGSLTIMLLDNRTAVPFVTGDQPVINIAANPKSTKPPARFDLFYPLSPQKAMLLLEPASESLPSQSWVSETAAHVYNLRMAAHSCRQVFATSPRLLEAVRSDLPAYLSCL